MVTQVKGFAHFGGIHSESAALKNLLAHAGVVNPHTGKPFSEALCFGIAGGIGAGYSFCQSVLRHGKGSGVSVVGRYKVYATDATWYQGFFDRLGATTRITETGGKGKALQHLVEELEAGRPTVVWCSQPRLPFLASFGAYHGMGMHTFVVHAVDESAGVAHGSDRAPSKVSLTLDELTAARAGVCSHKNRTLTFAPPPRLSLETLRAAVGAGMEACANELLHGKMKTYSLPGLESWAKMITNNSNKDGWGQVFAGGLLYNALRDVFDSIETNGNGGGLFRPLYADFLDEAAAITGDPACADLARAYRQLGVQWAGLAEAVLPDKVKPFKQTKKLLRKKSQLFEEKGEKATKQIADTVGELQALEAQTRQAFPLADDERDELLEGLRGSIEALHTAEKQAAEKLAAAVA